MWKRLSLLGRRRRMLLGVLGVFAVSVLASELRYVDWEPVVAPVDTDPIVVREDGKGRGAFGAPRSGGRRHRGIDLVAPLGSPVYAIRSGRVVQVEQHAGLGTYVELRHRDGLHSLYAHLTEARVGLGQRLRQGQVLGVVGKTGNARHPSILPHVHLEVKRGNERLDPAEYGLARLLEIE